jgi:hypothetical protein
MDGLFIITPELGAWVGEVVTVSPHYLDEVFSEPGRRLDTLCQNMISCMYGLLADRFGAQARTRTVAAWNGVDDGKLSSLCTPLQEGAAGLPDLAILHLEVVFLARLCFGVVEGSLPEHILSLYRTGALPTQLLDTYPYGEVGVFTPPGMAGGETP